MALVGGFAALGLAALFVLLAAFQDDFILGAGFAIAGVMAFFGAWLIVAAAPWATEQPAYSRWLHKLWELPFIASLGAFMLWVRLLPYNALVGSGRSFFIGTDPFYHYREVLGITRAFPFVPRWDPWTFYPNGTSTGQFGSLYDWVCAAFIVATQGRGASEAYVQLVLGVYPAILGCLIVIPFYFLAKKLVGTPGAIVGAITIALLPGEFLIRSIAGYSDHHVAEALTCLIGILGVYVAATRGHASGENFFTKRGAWPWTILGGLALALNFYVWQPAILFLAILTLWLTVVILLEDGKGGDARGYAFGGALAFAVTGLLMLPVVETTTLGEFNTYGILHPIASFAAAIWLVGVHFAARATRARGLSPWVVPGVVVGAGIVGYLAIVLFLSNLYSSVLWGLSWVTGFGVQRTTFTIAEARQAQFFCQGDTQEFSCLATDFGATAPIAVFILIAVAVWVFIKRRPADILLLIWSFMIFQATRTQIRFSYYLALNIALLIAWLAARVAEATGLEAALSGREVDKQAPTRGVKGRKTRVAEKSASEARAWQFAAVAAVFVIVLPGNVLATDSQRPAWTSANIRGADGDLQMWMLGLDWMRNNTPDAGVDLGLVAQKPAEGELYDYPPQTYGVLTWWDYGHWIQTIAQRPPVANPFQQAAPFAAKYFTERNPDVAETLLDDWVGGKGPVRYVMIDDAIAAGKWGAITVWAHSQNASRAQWAGGQYIMTKTFQGPDGPKELPTYGPEYRESMMGRLYDDDANGLSHYRLVWEYPAPIVFGNVATDDGRLSCLHEGIDQSCSNSVDPNEVAAEPHVNYIRGRNGGLVYDAFIASPLKIFERVEGARLVGTATPGARVQAAVQLTVDNGFNRGYPDGSGSFVHTVTTTAGPDGKFEIVFPYATTGDLGAQNGGTNTIVRPAANSLVIVAGPGVNAKYSVSEAAVLEGLTVQALS